MLDDLQEHLDDFVEIFNGYDDYGIQRMYVLNNEKNAIEAKILQLQKKS